MMNRFFTLILIATIGTACVSPKVYKDLEAKYNALKKQNSNLKSDYDA